MTSHVARLYALALGLLVLFVTWAAVAARPWPSSASPARDARLVALAAREQRLRLESIHVRRVVARRWIAYRVALRARNTQIAHMKRQRAAQLASTQTPAGPSVRVVTLPPLTVTRTS
jgi:hypothetical protein